MDWIERVFHVSPDGGNGVTELVLVVVPALAVTLGVLSRRARRLIRGEPRTKGARER